MLRKKERRNDFEDQPNVVPEEEGCSRMSYLYMLVSKDELELPLAVAGNPAELGRMIDVNANTISSAISKAKSKGNKSRYVKVKVGK